MGRAGSNARQKEFVKEYERLCHRFNRHEVWQDFVSMVACSIANAADKRHAEKREAWYMTLVKKYTREEMDVFPHLFALLVLGMEEFPDCDFLGELYMQLELGNAKNGQFFTPYSICRMMAETCIDAELMEAQLKKHGYISVNDPACGAGATLVAAAMVLEERGVNYQQQVIFTGQDIDYTTALMCYIQLSLLGCAGYVHVGDTLSAPMTGHVLFGDGGEDTWYTPMFFTDAWHTRRAAERMRQIFRQLTPSAEEAEPETAGNAPQTVPKDAGKEIPAERGKDAQAGAQKAVEALTAEPPPEETPKPAKKRTRKPKATAPEPEKEPEQGPVFVVSTKKKNAGQLMLDFG